MKYAIIQSGGKQYRCEEGATIEVDRLPVTAGATHTFTDVLLVADEGDVKVGTPTVAGAQVAATALEEFKAPKVVAFRYKAKERQRKKRGHRQIYTRLKIEQIAG
jgi:large subunit ribosomal protein L21